MKTNPETGDSEKALIAPYLQRDEKRGTIQVWIVDGSYVRGHVDEEFTNFRNGTSVWIVNGRVVRSVFDIDFTAGGHDHVYEFVPEKEVWIDDAIIEKERGFVLLHELHERNQMARGIPYSQAHAESSRLEFRCRHHPDELHDALAAEGWA